MPKNQITVAMIILIRQLSLKMRNKLLMMEKSYSRHLLAIALFVLIWLKTSKNSKMNNLLIYFYIFSLKNRRLSIRKKEGMDLHFISNLR